MPSATASRLSRHVHGTQHHRHCTQSLLRSMPVPCGPFGQAPWRPLVPHAREPSSVDSSRGACVAETPVRTFINAAPATSPDTAHEIVAQGNRPSGVPLHQQSPWVPVHLDRLESALARHPHRAFVTCMACSTVL